MSVLDTMKNKIKESGSNKKEIVYFGKDSKQKFRFLQELDTAYEYDVHSSWNEGFTSICKASLGDECPLCEDNSIEDLKLQTYFALSVWDYESQSVRIMFMKANGISPIPSLIEYYEEYGTIMDRDYTIKKQGSGMGSSMTVLPGEKMKFSQKNVKPLNQKQIEKILLKAFPMPGEAAKNNDDDDDEDEAPKKSKSKSKKEETKKAKKEKKDDKKWQKDLEACDEDELKAIAIELGMTKKELKGIEDEDELLMTIITDYEKDDIVEAYNSVMNDDDDDEDEDDED